MKVYDVLCIGGGPAGVTIAKVLGKKMSVGIIRPEDYSMIYCAMPYAIEGQLPLQKVFKSDSIVVDAGAELIRDTVTNVDFDAKTLTTESKDKVGYKKLVIATGARPFVPPLEGANLHGVMSFKTEKDLRNIMELIDNGVEKIVVIGAGAIGVELAQATKARGLETHLIDLADQILPNMMDYEMVQAGEEELPKMGIKVHLKSKVVKIEGHEFAEEIFLDKGETIHLNSLDECSSEHEKRKLKGLVVFAVGTRPNVELFKDSDLEIGRDGIVVNGKMETNLNSVFAVGDCCQFESAITSEVISGKLATNAVPMARLWAKNQLGANRNYEGFFNGAATKLENYFVGGSGLSEKAAKDKFDIVVGYSELTTAFPIMDFAKKVKVKLIVNAKNGEVIGGQVISGEPVTDKVDQITMMIQYKININQIVDFSYSSQPYQSFFPANNLFAAAAEQIVTKMNKK